LVLLQDLLLSHYFESEDFIPSTELDELDSTESAVAQSGKHLEIVAFELPQDLLAVLLKGVELVLLHYNNYNKHNYHNIGQPIIR
jgi:hypothetical protein